VTRLNGNDILSFLRDLFLLKYLPNIQTGASYGLLFIFGVLTSFHCLAMCGGIAISQSVAKKQTEDKNSQTKRSIFFMPTLLYNAGRVVSYAVIGGIVGGVGRIVNFSGALKGIIPIIGGIFMIIMAINLIGVFPFLRKLNISMPAFIAKKIRNGNNYGPLYVGIMNGLMPCAPLQIVQLYALSTRSVLYGAATSFIFALGTVPILFSFGLINSVINKKYSTKILKISAVIVLILGIGMVGRGLSLSGLHIDTSNLVKDYNTIATAKIEGNVQNVTTEIKSDSYPPIVVHKGVHVKWTIKVSEDNINDCNNTINIPQFKIEKKLQVGDNLIEFTPSEDGKISYSCWMGMIKSKIIVK
jgi:sulfite exporter TauE/SafE